MSDDDDDSCGHDECGEYCRYSPEDLEREWQDHPERFYWPEDGGLPERFFEWPDHIDTNPRAWEPDEF